MNGLEQRIKAMEEMIAEIHAFLVQGKKPLPPDAREYRRAIEAMADGDRSVMQSYLKRGGKVYKAEEIYPDAPVQRDKKVISARKSNASGVISEILPVMGVRPGHDPRDRKANIPNAGACKGIRA